MCAPWGPSQSLVPVVRVSAAAPAGGASAGPTPGASRRPMGRGVVAGVRATGRCGALALFGLAPNSSALHWGSVPPHVPPRAAGFAAAAADFFPSESEAPSLAS